VPVVTQDDVRRAALSLPATTERPSYGTPGFRVKDKLSARIPRPSSMGRRSQGHAGRWQTASTLLPSGSRTKAPK
jgi:hypothetical protein